MMACFGRSIASRTFLPLPAGPAATAGPPHGFDRSRTDAVATAIRPSLLKVTCDDRPTPLHSTLYSPRAGCLPATVTGSTMLINVSWGVLPYIDKDRNRSTPTRRTTAFAYLIFHFTFHSFGFPNFQAPKVPAHGWSASRRVRCTDVSSFGGGGHPLGVFISYHQMVLHGKHTRDLACPHLGYLLIHRAVHDTVQLYISVLDHDADGSLWIKRVLLQGRVPVDGHCRPYAEFVVELRKRQDVNFILHVAHAGSVFDDRERRRLVRIGPGIASDGYNSILHAYLEVVEHNPVANAVVTKPIRDGFMQLLVRDRYYRFHRDEVAHTLDAVVLARQMLRFHLLAVSFNRAF